MGLIQLTSSALLCVAMIGCAAPDTQQAQEPREQAEYVTGSNIPKKDRSSVKQVDREALQREMQRNTGGTGRSDTGGTR